MSRLSPEQIEALRKIDSPTVSNAIIDAFKVRDPTDGYASLDLRCMFPDLGPMVGYAVTCTADSTTPGGTPPRNLLSLYEAVAAAPKPAVVVIQDIGVNRLKSLHAGDMMMTMFQRLGAVGLVTDGGVRDLARARRNAPGFQVYARGTVVSDGTLHVVEVGITVAVCGLVIRPGDLLHGDESGLLTVPIEIAHLIPEQAERIQQQESEWVSFVKSEVFSLEEAIRSYGV